MRRIGKKNGKIKISLNLELCKHSLLLCMYLSKKSKELYVTLILNENKL